MAASSTHTKHTRVTDGANIGTPAPLQIIVGFDGSESSFKALKVARQLAGEHAGRLRVVYVAHPPAAAVLSPSAIVGIRDAFDVITSELMVAASSILGEPGGTWTFQRRDGGVANELLAAAAAAADVEQIHGSADVVIVVGSSMRPYHRFIGSVPPHLAHQHRFAVTVVPSEHAID